MLDDDTRQLAAAIFERVIAGRILRDGTTATHLAHDAAASLEAAKAFEQTVREEASV
jgi:hypothetical protein